VLVGDEPRALRLYELLLPHADDNAVSYTQQPFGPVGLRLGRLAALLGRWREADRHFAAALARCELLGARALRARVLLEHAKALAARGEPADRGRVEALSDEARQLCGELAIPDLLARVEAPAEPPAAVFRREGDVWTVSYSGQTFRLRDVKGLRYISTLLSVPGRDVHVLELLGATSAYAADGGPVLDERAKQEYGRRLSDLEAELEEAQGWGDTERAARVGDEIELLTHELAAAVGLGGRDRRFASPAERARISVTKAIRTAIKLVEKHSPELAVHLDSSIQTGRFCSYAPRGVAPPTWLL
jgi:hypothetical protein